MKKENSYVCSLPVSTAIQNGRPRKRQSRKMIRALRLADHHCEMCQAEDSYFFPLASYHLDGADLSWRPDLTVILCPSCLVMTARAWPPGSAWQNGIPCWAWHRGIYQAAIAYAKIRGPRSGKKRKKLTREQRGGAGTTGRKAESHPEAIDELLAGKSTVPDPEQKKVRAARH